MSLRCAAPTHRHNTVFHLEFREIRMWVSHPSSRAWFCLHCDPSIFPVPLLPRTPQEPPVCLPCLCSESPSVHCPRSSQSNPLKIENANQIMFSPALQSARAFHCCLDINLNTLRWPTLPGSPPSVPSSSQARCGGASAAFSFQLFSRACSSSRRTMKVPFPSFVTHAVCDHITIRLVP